MSDDTRERSRDASAPPNGSDGNQTMFQPDDHLNAEMVSAWLDTPDDFSEQERLAIETHLAGCADCSQIAVELTAIVRAFQTLPLVATPHSFALTPEMAGLRATPTLPSSRRLEEPANLHERRLEREARKPVDLYEQVPWYERQMRALRWATTIAAMLFVFVISVDVLGNIGGGSDDDDDSSVAMDSSFSTDAAQEEAGAGAEATTGAAAAEPAATEASDGDTARSEIIEPTPASGSGGGLEPTPETGETEADEEQAAEEEAPPATDDTVATPADEDTIIMIAPDETAAENADDEALQTDGTTTAYSGQDLAEDGEESNVLHLLQLGLAILIAWLVVAMIALPRLRRPTP